GGDFVAAGTGDGRDGLRGAAAAGVAGRGAQVGRALVGVLVAAPRAEVQGVVPVVHRGEGHAAGVAHAFVARAAGAAEVEHAEARGVAPAAAQVADALLELAAAEQAGGAGERTLHHQDLVRAGEFLHRPVRLEVADGDLAAERGPRDVDVAEPFEPAAGGEVVLQLVVPAERLALQGQARAPELAGAGDVGLVAVEGVGVEVDPSAERGLDRRVVRGDLVATRARHRRRGRPQLVEVSPAGDAGVRLHAGARLQLRGLGRRRGDLGLEFNDFECLRGLP